MKVPVSPDVAFPFPVVLVGVKAGRRANFFTVSWITRGAAEPPAVVFCVDPAHFSTPWLLKHGEFSLNLPGRELVEKTDFCGIFSGQDVDKSKLFTVFYGASAKAPMIAECPVTLECAVIGTRELNGDLLIFGEIKAAHAETTCADKGRAVIPKAGPLVWAGKHYWSLGEDLGQGYSIGKRLAAKKN
jgi:flavin reductase (DIM6/NTAB) family NADH-FMN oxidoreductase RutF